jgi:predicted RNA-binding Zn-ribbon protein involved in translation (DUF1610 family)
VKVTVMRLKNAPSGQPYGVETVEDLTPEQAGKLSVSWWDSRGTLAMVLFADGKEDSRYRRDYMDAERVPEAWPAPAKPARVEPTPPKLPPALARAAQRPVAPPTVVNPRKAPPKEAAACPTCDRALPRGAASPAQRVEGGCPTCGRAFTCRACLRPLPKDRRYEGDDDPTPSGRLADHRCPECGAPQRGMSSRDIWNQYTGRR